MKPLQNLRQRLYLKAALTGLNLLLSIAVATASTIYWKGTTSSDWGTGSNWSGGAVPGSSDDVQIGVGYTFTNQPVLNSRTTTTIASLTFGTLKAVTLTINSGSTLSVTGNVKQNPSSTSYGSFTTTIAGEGSIVCAALNVGDNSTLPPVLANNYLKVVSTISSFHITGNVAINSTNYGVLFVGIGYNNATLSLKGGTTTIDGTIQTANTSSGILPTTYATPKFSVDIPSGSSLSPVLKLTNASAIASTSVSGTIDFYNNTGGTGSSTVYYSGSSAQEVYTNSGTILDSSPQTYQNLYLTGSGAKTTDGGTLTVGNNLNSSASVAFNTNNTIVTIGGSWTNSGSATQGSGNITLSGSLTNNSGGTLNLGTANFYIAGNYTNNTGGVYSQSTGTTYFNGTVAQSLTDNSSTGTMFKLVDFSGGGTATMNSGTGGLNFSVAPTGILTMSNASTLVAGSSSAAYLTLKSDTTGTAAVAAIPSGCSINGFVAAQRFVQGSALYDSTTGRWLARNYRLMTSPVNEGTDGSGNYPCSLNYLGASTIITDCTSTYSSTSGNPSLYLFDEYYSPSNAGFTSGNFIGVTNISSTTASGTISTTDATDPTAKIYVGDGFMLYFRGDKTTHISGSPSKTSYPFVAPESVTFSTSGYLNQGTYAVRSWDGTAGLMYTTVNYPGNAAVQGFNLVGNPYPSTIDWSTFSSTNSSAPIYGYHVDPTIYILNPTTNNYDTYDASTNTSTGSASKNIPGGQGFFVRANNSSPALTFNESAKTSTQVTGSNLLMGKPASMFAKRRLLRLKLVLDSLNYDDIAIGFSTSATKNYDEDEDSAYLPGLGSAEGLSSFSADNMPLSVNFLPLPKLTPDTIRLDVEGRLSRVYTLQRTELDSLPPIYEIWLMDNLNKDSLDLRHNSTYAFNLDVRDTNTFGSHRFSIIIRQSPALGIHLLSFSGAKKTDGAQLNWTTENEENYTYFTIEKSTDGGTTFDVIGKAPSNASGSYSFLDKNPLPGNNLYRVKIEDLNGTITYTNNVTLAYNQNTTSTANNTISVYPNPASGIINLAINQQNATGLQKTLDAPGLNLPPNNNLYGIRIFNTSGAIVRSSISLGSTWTADVNNLVPGAYVIQVINNDTEKVVGKSTFIKL